MKSILIVEDEEKEAEILVALLKDYGERIGEEFRISLYRNPVDFLENYQKCDIVFMDIMLPLMDGMECSRRLRQIDKSVMLVFVTNMAKFAIKGYEVGAFDFILKPVIADEFKLKMDRIIGRLDQTPDQKIAVTLNNSTIVISVTDIRYIEIYAHKLTFHTVNGDIESYGSLKQITERLPTETFVKCNKCYIVNLDYVTGIDGNDAILGKDRLQIAQKKRRDFSEQVKNHFKDKA